MAISAALASDSTVPYGAGQVVEIITVTGATGAAGDAAAAVNTRMERPQRVLGGAFSYAISGKAVTLTARLALANASVDVEVIGYE